MVKIRLKRMGAKKKHYFIINDSDLTQLHQKIDAVTRDAHFCKAPEQC